MIGSPDLLVFTGTEGFGEDMSNQDAQQPLPEELSVPTLPCSHPWTTAAQFRRDFILVAEFSEQVGPMPVLTIPDDHRVLGSFDLNHFSVRIMSVDYQAQCPVLGAPVSLGPHINFSEDSKVVLGDSAEGAFAYVQHLTLYDLEARGMVRPFCMAYVSSDQAKLMEHFCELSAYFSQASDSLKTGNRRAFSTELQRKLQELEYKRFYLQQADLQRTATEANELAAVECSISDHRELLRQVTSYPNRKLKQPDFLPYDPADSLTDLLGMPAPESGPGPSTYSHRRFEQRLKPLEELSDAYFLSLMMDQLTDAERRLRGDRSVLRTTRITSLLSRKLTLTNFLFDLWRPEEEMGEDEQDPGVSEQKGLRGDRNGSEPLILESFSSCVEEIPIQLEAGEAGAVTPDPDASTGMTGSLSSGDSIEVLGTEKSYRTQGIVTSADSRDTPVGMTDISLKRLAAEAGCGRVRARRTNSEDSIEVLSTTESIVPEDLNAITEEEPESQPVGTAFEEAAAHQEDKLHGTARPIVADETLNGIMGCEKGVSVRQEDTVSQASCFKEITVCSEQPVLSISNTVCSEQPVLSISNTVCSEVQVEEELVPYISWESHDVLVHKMKATTLQIQEEFMPQCSEVYQCMQKPRVVPGLHVNFAPEEPLAEGGPWSRPSGPLRLLSVDEASDCTSFSSSSEPVARGNSRRASQRRRRNAAFRALKFLHLNSFSQNAIFCLLSGRPLVVIGGDEGSVRKLVSGLTLFLPAPGPEGNAVVPCLTTPLQLADLLTWRLIGIHRTSTASSSAILHSLDRYSRYLARLDIEQRTLHCPPYTGSLVRRLADPHALIFQRSTYLHHLETGLTALTSQALLYTCSHALHLPSTASGGSAEHRREFLFKWGFCSSDDDVKVMQFLSHLIKQHHAGRGPPVLRFTYSSMYLHKNTIVT